jgi:DNA-binding transcriptional LysR family regulator
MTAPASFATTFLAPLLPPFLLANPAISVHLDLTGRNSDILAEGFDLAIRIGRPPPNLGSRTLMGNPVRLMASPAYVRRWGEPRTPDDLSHHPLLLIGGPRARPTLELQRGSERIEVAVAPRMICSDPLVVIQAVVAGVGVGLIPLILAGERLRRGELSPVLSEWAMPGGEVHLVHGRGGDLPPRVAALIDHLVEALSESAVA